MVRRRHWAWDGCVAAAVLFACGQSGNTAPASVGPSDAGSDGAPVDAALQDGGAAPFSSCVPEETCDGRSCCSTLDVPAGQTVITYASADGGTLERTLGVSAFRLDEFEVTVGRLRRFVQQGYGTQARPPASGSGAFPTQFASGWDSAWDREYLAMTTSTLQTDLDRCDGSTWHDPNASMPADCVSWYLAFAFCTADGGRLPTEAEWTYAASGNDKRVYPWSSPPSSGAIDSTRAVYCESGHDTDAGNAMFNWVCDTSAFQPVGSRSVAGRGPFGHSDLAGNAFEWTLDGFGDAPENSACTTDCVEYTNRKNRVLKGGSAIDPPSGLLNASRVSFAAGLSLGNRSNLTMHIGFRCARDR